MGVEVGGTMLARKIASIAALTSEERRALEDLPMTVRSFPPRQDIVRSGEKPSHCCLVMSGFAFRYKLVGDGRRQIVNFHVAGDIPDLQSLHLTVLDHHLAALTAMTAAFIAHEAMHQLTARFPRIAGALWRNTLVDAALLRERVVTVGQRDALGRTSHLLCELYMRLEAVGLAADGAMTLPITQVEMADTVGISPVHMNRMIRDLRERGAVALDGPTVRILRWDELAALGDFDPLYLHLAPTDPPKAP